MILLDSDHLTVVIDRRSANHVALMARLNNADDFLSVPVVCVKNNAKVGWPKFITHARCTNRSSPTNGSSDWLSFSESRSGVRGGGAEAALRYTDRAAARQTR